MPASGGGDGLVEDGVEAVVDGADELGEGVEVGAYEFGDGAVFEDEAHDGLRGCEALQYVFGGGVLLGGCEGRTVGDVEFVVEHLAELARGVDVEGVACEGEDLLFDVGALGGELLCVVGEGRCVNAYAGAFHGVENVDER